ARALLGHTGDHRAWGIGGLMRVESGADGQGLAVTVAPSYGDATADPQALWDGLRAGRTPADLHARLDAEVGYGLPAAELVRALGFGDSAGGFGDGMLTPYSALRVGESNRDYRLGVRWSTGPRVALDLSARHIDATDNAVTLEGKLRF
ncbi:MAG: hypothetical protein OXU96_07815, partial [Gammaproteobacteria bacterium]|nr:hypothetical protein [Gammaproteobacteria bacterium]